MIDRVEIAVKCDECGDFTYVYFRHLPATFEVKDRLQDQGWSVSGKDVCPKCVKSKESEG